MMETYFLARGFLLVLTWPIRKKLPPVPPGVPMDLQRRLAAIVLLALFTIPFPALADSHLVTPFEISGGTRTPRYAETIAWCEQLAVSSPIIDMGSFGISPQGRPLPVMVADLEGRFSPSGAEDRVVILVQACIHAGESCGKDAGMILLRDMTEDPQLAADLLTGVTLVFIPIFNVDGHERFGPYNRANQNGPQEMGWRVTAQNQNLNRDYMKADQPEMLDWLRLFGRWNPDFFIDIHTTDGADYQYPLTYQLETRGNMETGLTRLTVEYRDAMHQAMAADGVPIAPYVSFREWHDPRSGLTGDVMGPRFSQGYTALRNRPGLLIETHMLKDYATRVQSARLMVANTLRWLVGNGSRLKEAVRLADRFTASEAFRTEPYALTFKATEQWSLFTFLGVDYEKVTSEITGGGWFRYFSDRPDTMQLRYYETMIPDQTALLPEAYLVPREWTVVIDRLLAHGITLRELTETVELEVRSWRLTDPRWRSRSYEGHHPVTFTAEPLTELRTFSAGSILVDMNQPLARVAAHLLEPKGPDSLVGWDYLDSIFERAEYIESYALENLIHEMVADDPDLLRQLEEKKAANPDFAADPWAIRGWFYEKTPYFDQKLGIYPIGLVDDRKQIEKILSK
jgi:hypothetical protein